MSTRKLRSRVVITAGLALIAGCAGTTPSPTPSPTPARSISSSPPASHAPGVIGRDWAEADLVEPPDGDPNATTPPYNNPGSLGHPQHYQGGQADLLDVAAAGSTFIAVGYVARDFSADAWYSDDGRSWTRVRDFPASESSVAAGVAGGPHAVVTVGGAGRDAAAWISRDGRVWRRAASAGMHDEANQIRMTSIAAWGDGFVAAGYVGSLVGPIRAAFWTSIDGEAWQRVADAPEFADSRVTSLTAAPDGSRLVAVGVIGDAKAVSGAVSWISTDGLVWQRADATGLVGAIMNSVVAGSDEFVAVGSDVRSFRAMAWRSTDGATWSEAPDDAALDNFGLKIEMRDVTWTGSGYLAGGHYLFGTQFPSGLLWMSTDGLAWTRATESAALSQGKIQGVVPGGPGLIAVGSFGSPDVAIPTVWISPPP